MTGTGLVFGGAPARCFFRPHPGGPLTLGDEVVSTQAERRHIGVMVASQSRRRHPSHPDSSSGSPCSPCSPCSPSRPPFLGARCTVCRALRAACEASHINTCARPPNLPSTREGRSEERWHAKSRRPFHSGAKERDCWRSPQSAEWRV
jgi:hypothetical protein